jgi:hypothetical protein
MEADSAASRTAREVLLFSLGDLLGLVVEVVEAMEAVDQDLKDEVVVV